MYGILEMAEEKKTNDRTTQRLLNLLTRGGIYDFYSHFTG